MMEQSQGNQASSLTDVFPTINNVESFCCPLGLAVPGDPARVDEWSDYSFITDPVPMEDGSMPQVYCVGGHHDAGVPVAFTDGSVRLVPDIQFRNLMGLPKKEETDAR